MGLGDPSDCLHDPSLERINWSTDCIILTTGILCLFPCYLLTIFLAFLSFLFTLFFNSLCSPKSEWLKLAS